VEEELFSIHMDAITIIGVFGDNLCATALDYVLTVPVAVCKIEISIEIE
jgi:hypothetical protein